MLKLGYNNYRNKVSFKVLAFRYGRVRIFTWIQCTECTVLQLNWTFTNRNFEIQRTICIMLSSQFIKTIKATSTCWNQHKTPAGRLFYVANPVKLYYLPVLEHENSMTVQSRSIEISTVSVKIKAMFVIGRSIYLFRDFLLVDWTLWT